MCAVITSTVAVVTYFRLVPGWEPFIYASRARATFKAPIVFGPVLILPALIVLQRIMFGGLRAFVLNGVVALLIAAGLFLSSSRGAWGHFVLSALVMLGFTYVTTPSAAQRLRIVVVAGVGAAITAAFIMARLSFALVAHLVHDPARLVQNYHA